MGQLFPSLEAIKLSKRGVTEGELHLLLFLQEHLTDEYEIYHEPYLNGDRPDIIVLRKDRGVLIIEVKDWDLAHYDVDKYGNWCLRQNNILIKSPIKQVETYKEHLFNLHIDHLLERKIDNKGAFAVVACAVYFHNASSASLNHLRRSGMWTELLGYDSLTVAHLDSLLRRTHLHNQSRASSFFDDKLYSSFQRYLQPPLHRLEDGQKIFLTKDQIKLAKSRPVQQKIRGVAGSGKTLVLAHRAVNAHLRTGQRVLILTFNITLRNYIHDKISQVREQFAWTNFLILNYHLFFKIQANNHNLPTVNFLTDCDQEDFFEAVKDSLEQYDAIFVDEIQDYKTAWIRLIKNFFLKPGGEFVVFGDEKQNIYGRPLGEDKMPNTTIPGQWNKLDVSFRLSDYITITADEFQKTFFREAYALDELGSGVQRSLLQGEQIESICLATSTSWQSIYKIITSSIELLQIPPNDVCVLAAEIEPLRELDYLFRINGKEATTTTFETKEEYEKLSQEYSGESFERQRDDIQRYRKFKFWANTGNVKLSTIHSFKGWEVPTLFLIIEVKPDNHSAINELIYTAITRCRFNLFVISLGNLQYHNFLVGLLGETASLSEPILAPIAAQITMDNEGCNTI